LTPGHVAVFGFGTRPLARRQNRRLRRSWRRDGIASPTLFCQNNRTGDCAAGSA